MSNKNYLILIFISSLIGCNNRTGKNVTEQKEDSTVALDTSFLKTKDSSFLYLFLTEYADSINMIAKHDVFPTFLEDAEFDYHHTGFFSPMHTPVSIRKMIIDKVTECNSLKSIINSPNKKYKVSPGKFEGLDVQYSDLSFADLAKKRYQELSCKD
ncbi:MAG: hypothetical protein JST75_21610 [Bacteroidetes bacterium]|nr:hypothetical protein [Bacteroidota bacterium]